MGCRYPGFWACMDTLKEKLMFDEMYARGETPWTVWDKAQQPARPPATMPVNPIAAVYQPPVAA
jgi:hypothetical protein